MAPPRILIVEDESVIATKLAAALRREGFAPRTASSAAAALAELADYRPHVVVLDVMLPDGDGRDLCRSIRRQSDVPIILATARTEPVDRVVGLEIGADDYVVKPYSSREMAARIRAVLRRAAAPEAGGGMRVGDVEIDPLVRAAVVRGTAVRLPARQFDLLHALMRNAGRVVRREELLDELWGGSWFGSGRTLDVHVARLREAIEPDPTSPRYITTIRGVGFRFATDEDLRVDPSPDVGHSARRRDA